MKSAILPAILLIMCAINSCGDDLGEQEIGQPPAITNLSYSPAAVTVAEQTTVTGTFDFSDQEGDVRDFVVKLAAPDGSNQTIGPNQAQGVLGQTAGTVSFAVVLIPALSGGYEFEVWLVDEGGNDSNRLEGSVEAS